MAAATMGPGVVSLSTPAEIPVPEKRVAYTTPKTPNATRITTFTATRTFSAVPVVRAPRRFSATNSATATTERTGRSGTPTYDAGTAANPRENSANAYAYIAIEPTYPNNSVHPTIPASVVLPRQR